VAREPDDLTLYIGDLVACSRPTLLRTTVGSCIAVCLFDPFVLVGGMNHFMLADVPSGAPEPKSYGGPAMEALLEAMERAGAKRSRLVARVFGGAHVIDGREGDESVPSRNIAFVHRYLSAMRTQVRSFEVGGYAPRRVTFESWTGHAMSELLGSDRP
jgi:chemotaxis protein CheD